MVLLPSFVFFFYCDSVLYVELIDAKFAFPTENKTIVQTSVSHIFHSLSDSYPQINLLVSPKLIIAHVSLKCAKYNIFMHSTIVYGTHCIYTWSATMYNILHLCFGFIFYILVLLSFTQTIK